MLPQECKEIIGEIEYNWLRDAYRRKLIQFTIKPFGPQFYIASTMTDRELTSI
jgi:hypothetical protein